MKKIAVIVILLLGLVSVNAQIPLQLDSVAKGICYFSITDPAVVSQISSGAGLNVWAWTEFQTEVTLDGKQKIKGYNKNFDITSSSTFKTRLGYLSANCDIDWFVWATITQPYGHRPPYFMDQVVNGLQVNEECEGTQSQGGNGGIVKNQPPLLEEDSTKVVDPVASPLPPVTIKSVGFKKFQTSFDDSTCGDTLITAFNSNQISFEYKLSDPFQTYSFAVGSDYMNLSLYKVSKTSTGGKSGTLEIDNGYFVSDTDGKVIFNLPASSKVFMGAVGWNPNNSGCPEKADHWKPKFYVHPK